MKHLLMLTGLLAAPCLHAQTAPQMPPANWTGNYDNTNMAIYMGTKVDMHGFKGVNNDLDPVIMAHLQPWATALMDNTDTEADDGGAVCLAAGILRHPSTVAGFYLVAEPDRVLLISSDVQEVGTRRIYLTDHHPDTLAPTWNGHSIGHWEGDTLVVDTIGFNDKSWLMSGREPHTEELHVVERMKLVADGAMMEVVTTVDDRRALTGSYSYTRYYSRTAKDFTQVVCNGTPGEQQRWNGIRQAAIEHQMQHRMLTTAPAATPPPAPSQDKH